MKLEGTLWTHWIETLFLVVLLAWAGPILVEDKASAQSSQNAVLDRIVAIVNGEIITLSEFQDAMARMRLGLSGLSLPTNDNSQDLGQTDPHLLEREVLNQLVERRLQLQLAYKRGITVNPEEVDQALNEIRERNGLKTSEALQQALTLNRLSLDQFKNDLRDHIMILKLANREVRSTILLDEKQLLDYYESHPDRYAQPDEIRLRQILLRVPRSQSKQDTLKKAEELVTRIRNGADFRSLAQEVSQGPEAKDGGDLGFIKKGELLSYVEKILFDLSPGEISDPIETQAGIHIFRIEEVKTGQIRPFEEVKQEIRESLFQERSAALYGEWLQNLRDAAQVEIRF
jgi:parvulin-like peptidyl-prolyl isomerase